MTMLKLIRIGNSVGVVLPKDILSRLNLEAGDALYLSESPDGYRLSRATTPRSSGRRRSRAR
jgi:putative addiction module antidote